MTKEGWTRITIDLSPELYNRLEAVQELVGAESKASVVRQSLRLYEYMAKRWSEGSTFQVRKDGKENDIPLLGFGPPEPHNPRFRGR